MTGARDAAETSSRAASASDLETTVRRFFADWEPSFEAMLNAFEDVMDARCRWDQRPMIVTRSRAHAVGFLKFARAILGLETAHVDISVLASDGDTVFTQRIDHLRRADGTLIASLPVTGMMRFRDGELVAWREYFRAAVLAWEVLRNTVRRRRLTDVC